MILNETLLKENLFRFIKEHSDFQTYKRALKLYTPNNILQQTLSPNDNSFTLTTTLNNNLISKLLINPETFDIHSDCFCKSSTICEHTIISVIFFLQTYTFDYHNLAIASLSPFELILEDPPNRDRVIIFKDHIQYADIIDKKSNNFYLKKYLQRSELTPELIEDMIIYQQSCSIPKYFVMKGKRSVIPIKISDDFVKIVMSIERLNSNFIKLTSSFENSSEILSVFETNSKKVVIYNNGILKILPPYFDFDKFDNIIKNPQVIDIGKLNIMISEEEALLNKNFIFDKSSIYGFTIPSKEPSVNIFLDAVEHSIHVSAEFVYDDIKVKLFDNNRIFEDKIFFIDNHEYFIREIFKPLNAVRKENSFILDKQSSLDFITDILPNKLNKFNIFGEEKLTRFKIIRPNLSQPSLNIFSYKEWFEIESEVDFGVASVNLNDLIRSIKDNKNYVKLKKDHYGIIPQNFIDKVKSIINDTSFIIEGKKTKIFKLNLIDKNYLNTIPEFKNHSSELLNLEKTLKNIHSPEISNLPDNLDNRLRDYQRYGVKWMLFLRDFYLNGILADQMGLGKTLQVLTLLNIEKANHPNLVIVPTSLLFNWENEIKKFSYIFDYMILYGKDREDLYKLINDKELILTTYNIIRIDFDKIKSIKFNYIVLDEAQYIKNPSSIISKYIKNLSSEHRLSITGTPFENNIIDIWSQFEFLHPTLLGNLRNFKKNYIKNFDDLKSKLSPLILRREKSDVLSELPEKTETTYYYEMNDEQSELYNFTREVYLRQIMSSIEKSGIRKSRFLIIEGLLRLRQICCHPKLVKFQDLKYRDIKSEKFENLKILLHNMISKNSKIVIYSQFVEMLKIIRVFLSSKDIPFEYLDGKTKNRIQRIENFQSSDNIRIFLISTRAGGLGINLTAADNVIIYDPWWNPAVEKQAIDRIHRIGQDKKVFAYKFIMRETVEEKILKLQDKKREIFDKIFVKSSTSIDFNIDDIKYIFT